MRSAAGEPDPRLARLEALSRAGAFAPVVVLPADHEVLDLSAPLRHPPRSRWTVGRYDEVRGIYDQPLFGGARCVHVGLDLGAPAGTAVHAFADGEVIEAGHCDDDGDYGPVIVTRHLLDEDLPIYALFGHLSAASLARSPVGRTFQRGDVLGWMGEPEENGGWPPHVHLQLSWERPETHDLPGVVTLDERADALRRYPDPRWVAGLSR